MSVIWIGVGAAIGAMVRHALTRGRHPQAGLLLANVGGAAVLGFVAAWGAPGLTYATVGTGFCGALTTMSGLTLSAVEGRRGFAVLATHLVLGVIAAVLAARVGVLPYVFSNAAGG